MDGKNGVLYMPDRARVGHDQTGGDGDAVQPLCIGEGIYSESAYWNGHLEAPRVMITCPISFSTTDIRPRNDFGNRPAVLHAFDVKDVGHELCNSCMKGEIDV
jgi:hypothetical protein